MLQLASLGYTRRQTAQELQYSYPYVRELAAAACRRLGARNVTQAVAMAVRAGLI